MATTDRRQLVINTTANKALQQLTRRLTYLADRKVTLSEAVALAAELTNALNDHELTPLLTPTPENEPQSD